MVRIPRQSPLLPATDGSPRPGDFQIGSEKSRTAAKLLAGRKKSDAVKLIVNPYIPRPKREKKKMNGYIDKALPAE
jgi:hypothetical protein